MEVTKFEAAERQLCVAIRMLFEQADQVATHTLAGAASVILHDMVQQNPKNSSAEKLMAGVHGITENDMRIKIRKAQNFFKHADRDGDVNKTYVFELKETIDLLVTAWQNYLTSVKADGQYFTIQIDTAPIEVKVFEAWFIARTVALAEVKVVQLNESEQNSFEVMTKIGHQFFPDFKELSLQEQLDRGHKYLNQALIEESSGKFPRNPTRPFTRH